MTESVPQIETVSCTIDGQQVTVPKGTVLVEACRQAGVDVPIFCYHRHMTPFGGCRQCLVKVEKVPKPVASCTAVVTDGMVVDASSDLVKSWREGIIAFLLANHPLECPTCDKGGECDLQNNAFAHGPGHSMFSEVKRHFIDYDMGPIVARDMDRCIQCQRCIRFGLEWSGDHAIDFYGRGAATCVTTFARGLFDSKFSGNTTELCPVGALTSEPFRLVARPWEMGATASICPHCAVGCNITNYTRQNELLRITSRENVQVNLTWTCDKGKYAVDFVNADSRLKTPMTRRNGHLAPASWQEALTAVTRALESAVRSHGAESIGFLGSQKASNEDIFMFQRLAREGVGTNNIDHRMGGSLPASVIPGTGLPLQEIERAKTVVLFDCEAREEAPVAWLHAHHARFGGAKLIIVDDRGNGSDGYAHLRIRHRPGAEVMLLEGLAARLSGGSEPASWQEQAGVPADSVEALLAELRKGFVVLAGPRVTLKGDGGDIVRALWALVDAVPGARLGVLHANNNTRGAYDMGAVPDHSPGWMPIPRPGLNAAQMLHAAAEGRLQVLYVMGDDVLSNFPDAALVKKALDNVPFLVVQDIARTGTSDRATVILPGLTYAEREGTFTNLEGRIQYFTRAVDPIGGGRPDWEICAALLQFLGGTPGVMTVDDVTRQIARAVPEYHEAVPGEMPAEGVLQDDRRPQSHMPSAVPRPPLEGSAALPLILLTGDILFDNGPLTRETAAFREFEPAPWIDISEHDAANAGIQHGDTVTVSSEFDVVDLTARVSDKMSPGTVFIPNKVADFRVNTLTSVSRDVQRVRIARKSQPAETT